MGKSYSQVQFIENKGQWDKSVKYKSDAGDGSFYLQEKGYTISQYSPDDVNEVMGHGINKKATSSEKNDGAIRTHTYSVEFVNSRKPVIIPEKQIPTVNNYFIGNDESKWASDCKIFQAVLYKDVYPGIDIRYYVDLSNEMKYDIIVHPGADVSNIAMKYNGANKLEVKKKELIIKTSLGTSKELKPYTYQTVDNERKEIDCQYEITGDVVKFKIKNYAKDKVLIIDPRLVFFSYSGSLADNWGYTATYGADGSLYGGGIVWATGFPTTPGEGSAFKGGTHDIGIIKLSPDGRQRIYATYLGGSGSEQPHSLIEDSQGNLIIAGRTNSRDYPTKGIFGRAYAGSGSDIIVTKLNKTGSAILGSLQIGGGGSDGVNISDWETENKKASLKRNYGDDARSEVILDKDDNIYLASCTRSSDFPVTSGAYQSKLSGLQDAVILKIDPNCDNLIFSTLLGGNSDDAAYVLKIGNNNNIYVAGGTASADFPAISKSGVLKPGYSTPSTQGDEADGFIVELANNGASVIRGTYIGTGKADQIYGIETDVAGNIYVMGTSEGQMPVINATYSNQGSKQFITKLNPELSTIDFQTVFGSVNAAAPNISPTAFLVDRCENLYVSGWGGYSNTRYTGGNVIGMPTTPDALKKTTNGTNFYFIVLERNAAKILYATYYGQSATDIWGASETTYGDHVDGGTSRFDKSGVIYQAVCADCGGPSGVSTQPTLGAWSTVNKAVTGSRCNLGLMKIEMDFTGVHSAVRSTIYGQKGRTNGCVPVDVLFEDTLKMGKSFKWLFGDGSPEVTTTVPSVNHTYTTIGKFRVRLISIDPDLSCHPEDTAYTTITIGNNRVTPDFDFQRLAPCESLDYRFTNTTSNFNKAAYKPGSFTWDFDDGSTLNPSDTSQFVHHFAGEGIYKVKLSITDEDFCNSPVDTVKTIHVALSVKAKIGTPPTGCAPYNAVFENLSTGGATFKWDFGDGSAPLTAESATHQYADPGTYTIRLTAYDSEACNKEDYTEVTITVNPKPTAVFTFSPLEPSENTFTVYSNQSLDATSYSWDFGDGEFSTEMNPRHIFPATGTFNVCLTAINDFGCADTTCTDVKSLIRPLLAVPNAFTPTQTGINSVIKVMGFGVTKMQWNIYNRWGQKVFESTNVRNGWDGTFKGKMQPVDVYSYTLDAELSNGKKVRQTGDITLLR